MGDVGKFLQDVGVLVKVLEKGVELLPQQDLKGFSNVVEAVFLQGVALHVVQYLIQVLISLRLHRLLLHVLLRLDFLCDFALVVAVAGLLVREDEEVGESLMVGGEDIGSDVGKALHVEVVGLMHGALEAETDESVSEGLVLPAVLHKYLDLVFDLIMNILYGEDFLEAKVLPLEDLRQVQVLQLLKCILLLFNHSLTKCDKIINKMVLLSS